MGHVNVILSNLRASYSWLLDLAGQQSCFDQTHTFNQKYGAFITLSYNWIVKS